MPRSRSLVTISLSGALLSCVGEQGTCQLATDAMVMWADVSDLDGEVTVEVEFETYMTDGDSSSLELCSSRDRLIINGQPASLVRAFGQNYYQAKFPAPLDVVEISLSRERFTSVTATLEMPPSFDIVGPSPGSSHSRMADMLLEWSPGWDGHEMLVSIVDGIGSSCIEGLGLSESIPDSGSYVVAAGSLQDGGAGASCNVTLLMTREQLAAYPAELHEGGELHGSVQRFRTLVSSP